MLVKRLVIKTILNQFINFFSEVWFRNWPWGDNWIPCDQLAMVAALNSKSVLKSSQHVAGVELRGELTRGMMVLDQKVDTVKGSSRSNITVIEKLDTEILMDYLLRAFSQTD